MTWVPPVAHRVPSAPAVTWRALVIRSRNVVNVLGAPGGILITLLSLTVHRLPSGPTVMWRGLPIAAIVVAVASVDPGANRATALIAVTHRLLPCAVMPTGLSTSSRLNFVTSPAGVIRATSLPVPSSGRSPRCCRRGPG